MRIEGLTEEQCKMLDAMWVCDTNEQLVSWFQKLDEAELEMALTLHQLLVDEIHEDEVERAGVTIARNMLMSIGVKC
jgi:hypothetical protein